MSLDRGLSPKDEKPCDSEYGVKLGVKVVFLHLLNDFHKRAVALILDSLNHW
jgi:hypothetical protein